MLKRVLNEAVPVVLLYFLHQRVLLQDGDRYLLAKVVIRPLHFHRQTLGLEQPLLVVGAFRAKIVLPLIVQIVDCGFALGNRSQACEDVAFVLGLGAAELRNEGGPLSVLDHRRKDALGRSAVGAVAAHAGTSLAVAGSRCVAHVFVC